ncbi:MAG: 50S ribosomal protein L35ae [Hadesarchaea archaeon]|nr:50S ribosomal protein L35ae [Hadesarchaea archaeon]
MRAVIVNFRGGLRTRYGREVIIRPLGDVEGPLIGRKAIWRNPHSGSQVIGRVIDTHGGGGYRVRFRLGLPGWAIGSELEIT